MFYRLFKDNCKHMQMDFHNKKGKISRGTRLILQALATVAVPCETSTSKKLPEKIEKIPRGACSTGDILQSSVAILKDGAPHLVVHCFCDAERTV